MRPGSTSTCSGLQQIVFLRTPAMLEPKIACTLAMCLGLMGQLLMGFFLAIFELSIGGMPGHGLRSLARGPGVKDFALGETLIALVMV
jgi:hypothetical protein